MEDEDVVRLEDARALKEMGLPVNLPIEKRHFSRETSMRILEADAARNKFLVRIISYATKPSARKYAAVHKALDRIDFVTALMVKHIEKLNGSDKEQDGHEAAIPSEYAVQIVTLIETWDDIFDRLEGGENIPAMRIGSDGMPVIGGCRVSRIIPHWKPREIHRCRNCGARHWYLLLPSGEWFEQTTFPVPPDLPADGRGCCDACYAEADTRQ